MSIIFGVRAAQGEPLYEQYLQQLGRGTAHYAPGGTSTLVRGRVGMALQSSYTHERSKLESCPQLGPQGNMLTFDGRLDNYHELQCMLGIDLFEIPDSRIVLSAFEHWGAGCFARFVGDWALALWSTQDCTLYLARDHAGTRTLYYKQEDDLILWSTFLETLFVRPTAPELDQEYAAGYLAGRPLRDRTPYRRVRAVPPAHYLRICDDRITCHPHWEWMIEDRLHYPVDRDYGDHFLDLFGQAVSRRTGPGAPIIAELSGGMDSTSIVCMSDTQRRSSDRELTQELIDTLSFFNDLEPAWNERPYFSIVEKCRGKIGIHIDTSRSFPTYDPPTGLYVSPLLPGTDSGALERERCLEALLNYRFPAIVSGIGGDELLGGVPSPMPELADLLVSFHLLRFAKRAVEWCLLDRSPLVAMFCRTTTFLARLYAHRGISTEKLPDWLPPKTRALCGYSGIPAVENSRHIGLSPSTIENGLTWWFLLESLPHLFPTQLVRREYRYPYLDRNLVEFLFRVPRDKLLGPGRRRKLMRNALSGIVPADILERRRKAYVVRKPLLSLQTEHDKLQALFEQPLLAEYGLVVPSRLRAVVRAVCAGRETELWKPLMRCILLELWLRSRATTPSSR